MTGRQYIAERMRILGLLPVPILVLCPTVTVLFGIYIDEVIDVTAVTLMSIIVGLVGAFLAGIALEARMRCPYCYGSIAPILRFGRTPFARGLPEKVKYCPLCGADFESEVKTDAANNPFERDA